MCEEEVVIDVAEGAIEVSHLQTMYNCCCTVEFSVVQEGFQIEIDEYEELVAGGCDCLCCLDTRTVITGLDPGEYELTIFKHTEHGGTELVGTWTVTVDGTSEPGVTSSFMPCDETEVTYDSFTWGVIKALFR